MLVELAGLKNAWLSPSGAVLTDAEGFDPSGAWHEGLAVCIIRDEGYPWAEQKQGYDYAYEYLERIGWVRLVWRGHKHPVWVVDRHLTGAQEEVVELWCAVNGVARDTAVDFAGI